MAVVFDKRTHIFKCLKCGCVTEIPRRVIFNSEAFAAMHERLAWEHSNGCPLVVVQPILRLPETDWQIEIRPLGVAQ